MRRDSLFFSLFRIAISFAILALLGLMYWSSLNVESEVLKINNNLDSLREQLTNLRHYPTQSITSMQDSSKRSDQSSRPHIDPNLPNLLQDDPFYEETLPHLLGPNFTPHGTLHSAVLTKPENLHPFDNISPVPTWVQQCNVSVARQKFGIYETLSPNMAIKLEERLDPQTGKTSFWVHLREGVFWQPIRPESLPNKISLAPHFLKKHPVTAEDFKFYWDAVMNPFIAEGGAVALRNYIGDIESIQVIDPLTFVVNWKHERVPTQDGKVIFKPKYASKLLTGGLQPLASFVYKYFADGTKIISDDTDPDTYRHNSVWAQNFSQHWAKNIIISCGPWIFEEMTDRQINFRRNPEHYFPLDVLVQQSSVEFKSTTDAMWQEFKANQLDTYNLSPTEFLELQAFLQSDTYAQQKKEGEEIKQVKYLMQAYFFIAWNQARPWFQSKKVRQALTMAIDRDRIIRDTLNGMGVQITSPFSIESSSYDKSLLPWPYDPMRARRQLEEEGWYDSNGDGIIDKEIDGERISFSFQLSYHVNNLIGKAICEYVSTALRKIGIECHLIGLDTADWAGNLDNKNFDACYMGWSSGSPPEDPKQLWDSAGAREAGSSNIVGFVNAEADQIIAALQFESDPKKRQELYFRFDRIIHEEAPYTFIYNPKLLMLYRERLQNVFIPADRQDLVPGANVAQPDSSIFWLRNENGS